MKVLLPSHGILGQKSVNMRIPTFRDIHEIQSYNTDPLLRRYHFVELITDADFKRVTTMDVEYLFSAAAFSLMYNMVEYKPECPKCKSKVSSYVRLSDLDIKELRLHPSDLPYHKRIKGVKYSYTLLSAQQMLDAYDYGQFAQSGEESSAFEDAQVALIMGKQFSDIDTYVKKLPVSVYLAAFLFQKLNYHGLEYVATARCRECGEQFKFRFKLTEEVLKFDIENMMSKFASVSSYINFNDFMSMSIIDFNAFVKDLNNRLKS